MPNLQEFFKNFFLFEKGKSEKRRTHKDYLDKTFLEELNHKIWTTKGARFKASTRLDKAAILSNACISIVTVYLIIAGLISVYNLHTELEIGAGLISYFITSVSILLLVFSQIENASNFSMKAKQFHTCGLELTHLYDELRIFKTLRLAPTDTDKENFAKEMSDKYNRILARYENHRPIDLEVFQVSKPKYFELNLLEILKINCSFYYRTKLLYHSIIIIPPVVFIAFIIF